MGKNSFNEVFPILNQKKYKATYVLDNNKTYYKKNLDIPITVRLKNFPSKSRIFINLPIIY